MSNGRRAIVTGASSGVGAATARALAGSGWDVAIVARRADRLKDLAAQLVRDGCHVTPIAADLSVAGEAVEAMQSAQRVLGGVDALVLCHGTNVPERRLDALTIGSWNEIITTNLSSAFYSFHAVAPGMRDHGGGRVIAISSVAALRPSTLSGAAYAASKAGLNAFVAVLNLEEKGNGIHATAINPGDVDTEIMDKRPEPPSAEARARMLRPEDIARVVLQVLAEPEHVTLDEITVRP